MWRLAPRRYAMATGLLLLVATGLLALGAERLLGGHGLVGYLALVLGVVATAGAFSLGVAGSTQGTTLLLLTREACPLCEEAVILLDHHQEELGYAWWEVDVGQADELQERFGGRLPVLMVDGQVVAELQVGTAEIQAAVATATEPEPSP